MFSLYRDIQFPGTLKLSTITAVSTATQGLKSISSLIDNFRILYIKPEDKLFEPRRDSTFQMLTSGPQGSAKLGIFNTHPVSVINSLSIFKRAGNSALLKSLLLLMDSFNLYGLKEFYSTIEKSVD
jgi:hypothetical protein